MVDFVLAVVLYAVGFYLADHFIANDWKYTFGAIWTIVVMFIVGMVSTWINPQPEPPRNDDGEGPQS